MPTCSGLLTDPDAGDMVMFTIGITTVNSNKPVPFSAKLLLTPGSASGTGNDNGSILTASLPDENSFIGFLAKVDQALLIKETDPLPDKLRKRLQMSFGADNYKLLELVIWVLVFQVCSPAKLELLLQNDKLFNLIVDIGKCNYTFKQFIGICSSSADLWLRSVTQFYDPIAPTLEASFPKWDQNGFY